MYKLKYEKKAEKFIKNLDFSIKKRVIKNIKSLQYYPYPRDKKHILETIGSTILCELSVDKLRVYYTVEDRFIVIEDIEYDGIISVLEGHSNHKSGSKKNFSNQRRDIGRLKSWFYGLFK